MNLIADIKTLLTGIETNIFLGDMPDTPDNLVGIFTSGGYNPVYNLNKDTMLQPTFQIIIRDISYTSANNRTETIKSLLDATVNQAINGTYYIGIFQQGDVLPLGKDLRNRIKLSINFRTQIRK